MGVFCGQNFEREYIDVLLNKLLLCVIIQIRKKHKSISSGIHQLWVTYIDVVKHTLLSWIIRAWPFATKRCSIKLKDEEAEIELTGSRLEEKANMEEIEED